MHLWLKLNVDHRNIKTTETTWTQIIFIRLPSQNVWKLTGHLVYILLGCVFKLSQMTTMTNPEKSIIWLKLRFIWSLYLIESEREEGSQQNMIKHKLIEMYFHQQLPWSHSTDVCWFLWNPPQQKWHTVHLNWGCFAFWETLIRFERLALMSSINLR